MVWTHVEEEDQFLHLHMLPTYSPRITTTSQLINNLFPPSATTGRKYFCIHCSLLCNSPYLSIFPSTY